MLLLSHWVLYVDISMSSSMIAPDEGTYHRLRSPTIVLFPLPLAPTSAVVLPAGTEIVKSRSTGALGRDGYANDTFVTLIPPTQVTGFWPLSSRGSSSKSLSITLKISDAAAAALVIAEI